MRHLFIRVSFALVAACSTFLLESCASDPGHSTRNILLDESSIPTQRSVSYAGREWTSRFAGIEFEDGHALKEVILLDGKYFLEYTPLVDAEVGSARVSVIARVEGEDLPLSTDPAIPLSQLESRPALALREGRVQIDVGQFQGKEIRLRWKLESSEDRAKALLADVRLRPAIAPRMPDILLICSDTHRTDYSISGRGPELMPRLADFAKEATVYTQAYAPASWTLPSIASIHTGLWPRFHGTGKRTKVIDKEAFRPEDVPPGEFAVEWAGHYQLLTTFAPGLPTFQGQLRRHGYTTVLVNSNVLYDMSGLTSHGFTAALTTPLCTGDLLNETAMHFIKSFPADEPLLLVAHYMDVHDHFVKLGDLTKVSTEKRVETYAAKVRESDRFIQDLKTAWAEVRDPSNTLTAFFADHGEHLGETAEIEKAGLFSHGQTMDDVLLRVPLVVSYPDSHRQAPGTVTRKVSLIDLAETVLQVAGVQSEGFVSQGVSLIEQTDASGPRVLFADFQLFAHALGSARQGSRKLVFDFDMNRKHALDCENYRCEELGDPVPLDAEVSELEAHYNQYREEADSVASEMRTRHAVDPEKALEHLRSLGYVQ